MTPTFKATALAFLAVSAFATPLHAESLTADENTRLLLKRPEFEQVEISPNGQLLAIARVVDGKNIVSINRTADLQPVRTIDPGVRGEITTLRWLDDERVIVGAMQVNAVYGVSFGGATLYIVNVAPKGEVMQLPASFVATIDGDTEHLLVSRCSFNGGDCVMQIRKALIGRLYREGELMVAAPDTHTTMLPDRQGRVRFAVGWEDDGTSKTWVLGDDGKTWTTINVEAKTGLTVMPLGVVADRSAGILQSERPDGPDVIERYDFATGKRTELLRDPVSDPLGTIRATDTREPIGAYFHTTRPRMQFWNPRHPQAALMGELQALFPNQVVELGSASRDGNLVAFEVSGDRIPKTFYLLDRRLKKARPLAQAYPWLKSEKLAGSREFKITARDGLTLHGVLTTPPGAAERKLPMVVIPHGGPYGLVDSWSYDQETQIIAQQGFAVLQVNFRGSGGYGKAFVNKGMRQWGKAMQDDVTDATRWAISQGIADPARLCIYGGSYGAYAAMMGAIREPDLYRCAAGYAGVYDLNKMYKWDSLRRSDLGLAYLHRAIGTDAADLSANSPSQQAARIKANVFLAHGRLDSVADFRFARAMERSINRAKGQKVDLVEYSYQGHGLLLPEQREDFYARLLRFLHANLDGAPPPPAG